MKEKKSQSQNNKEKEKIIEFLKKLPEGRRIYYKAGSIMVEVTKEEAIKLLEDK